MVFGIVVVREAIRMATKALSGTFNSPRILSVRASSLCIARGGHRGNVFLRFLIQQLRALCV